MVHGDAIIRVEGLTKRFGALTAVNNVDLTVYQGEVFGFLGLNGAGKSTTIRMLLTLIRPTKGTISIFGLPLPRHRKQILRDVGALVERPDFYLYLTAYQNLRIAARLSGKNVPEERIYHVLEVVRLAERAHDKVKTFSHGMKQRLGIAQALLHDPQLIILDEPTVGLDPQGMKELRDLIRELAGEQGKTVFLSSHILKEIEEIADRVAIIHQGSVRFEGTLEQILSRGNNVITLDVSPVERALSLLSKSPLTHTVQRINEARLRVVVKPQRTAGDLIALLVKNGVQVTQAINRTSLEEAFLEITGGNYD